MSANIRFESLRVPLDPLPEEFVLERGGKLYIKASEICEAIEFAVEISSDPSKHDMSYNVCVVLLRGKYYRFSYESSYNYGVMADYDADLTEVAIRPLHTQEWVPVDQMPANALIEAEDPKPGDRYLHQATGNVYVVRSLTIDTETGTPSVVYEREDEHYRAAHPWSRPLSMFKELVGGVPRFSRLSADQTSDSTAVVATCT